MNKIGTADIDLNIKLSGEFIQGAT